MICQHSESKNLFCHVADSGYDGHTMNLELAIGIVLVALSLGGSVAMAFRNLRRSGSPGQRAYVTRACGTLFVVMGLFIVSLVFAPSPWRYMLGVLWLAAATALHYRFVVRYQILQWRESSPDSTNESEDGPANGKARS
jgi:hypothetical protein